MITLVSEERRDGMHIKIQITSWQAGRVQGNRTSKWELKRNQSHPP